MPEITFYASNICNFVYTSACCCYKCLDTYLSVYLVLEKYLCLLCLLLILFPYNKIIAKLIYKLIETTKHYTNIQIYITI